MDLMKKMDFSNGTYVIYVDIFLHILKVLVHLGMEGNGK
jgi:hypothetical protein